MRWSVFIVLQGLILLAIAGVFYIHQDRAIVLKKPPQSLAKWYKPENKRQVWLHTMFKLRREAQAIDIYAKAKDTANLQKWAGKLDKDYRKISEMVPEWASRVDLDALADLNESASENNFDGVTQALHELNESCALCHKDFRAVSASLYRAPDFANLKIEGAESLSAHMQSLSKQVNRIKIGFVDERREAALSALADLRMGMSNLGETCANCHKKASKSYPNEKITLALATLEQSLKTGTIKDKGRALGTLAVIACAQCHGTHRLSYDAKTLFDKKMNWGELLKHSF